MRIGVFDSGLGGITVLRLLRDLIPDVDLLYFADQRNVPYGDRTDRELRGLLAANVRFLEGLGVDAIAMGCNTSCAIAARYGWPAATAPVFDLIVAAADAVESSGARNVGVLATAATARTGAYGCAIASRCSGVRVEERAAPALVPLVESGELEGSAAYRAVAEACASFEGPLDAVVLACSHFPLLDGAFAAVLGDAVQRIDPAHAQAKRVARWVRERRPFGTVGLGETRYLTSGPPQPFRARIERLIGCGRATLDQFEDAEEQEHGEGAERHACDHLSRTVRLEVHP